ncbi:MAG: hypothetical protein COA79_05715 [Planctomycetota bacterium]|nr:MAG: hypothetical protein COA79_05715 [Planctomycetota bacterium]
MDRYYNLKNLLLVPIEVLVRDLEPRLYLAANYLENIDNGICVLGPSHFINNLAGKTKIPFLYLAKAYHLQKSFYTNLKRLNSKYVIVDAEGGVYSKWSEANNPRGGCDSKYFNEISRIYFWGESSFVDYKKRYDKFDPEKQSLLTGYPLFDLRKNKFDDYYRSRSDKVEKPDNYLLVNTSWGLINNILPMEDEIKFENGSDHAENVIKTLHKFEADRFLIFLEGVKRISNEHPNLKIVIRPHPVEKSETYIEYFKSLKNVIVSKEGVANEWMVDAKILIHTGCTTAIENFIGGRDSICFVPNCDDQFVPYVPLGVSDVANNADELSLLIKDILGGRSVSADKKKSRMQLVKTIIDNQDYDSGQKIGKDLVKLSLELNQKDTFGLDDIVYWCQSKDFIKSLYRKIRSHFYGNRDLQRRSAEKFIKLDFDQVSEFLCYLENQGITTKKISIKPLSSSAFALYIK